jgi:hypothetical protein
MDFTVAKFRDVELTIVDKLEEVFDGRPIIQNVPKLQQETFCRKKLMMWHPVNDKDSMNSSTSLKTSIDYSLLF